MRVENSFLPVNGIGEATERQLWDEGITHWDAFTPDALGPTRAQRVLDYVDIARDRLDTGEARFFAETFPTAERWRLYENFAEDALFFDIETTGLDSDTAVVTTVTVHSRDATRTFVRGDDLSKHAIEAAFDDASLLVSYNGRRFDVPFLEDTLGVTIETPQFDLMYPCRRLDLTGGLSEVESAIGIDRDRPDLGGRDAVRLWHEHERGRDGALDTLITYNREDTENLRQVAEHVTARLHETVFAGRT